MAEITAAMVKVLREKTDAPSHDTSQKRTNTSPTKSKKGPGPLLRGQSAGPAERAL